MGWWDDTKQGWNSGGPVGFVGNALFGDPGKNQRKAAGEIRDLAPQAQQFSDLQWQRQMQGLQGAENQFMPAMDYWNKAYGDQSNTGAMENAFSQRGQSVFNPTNTSSVFGNAMAWQPTGTNNAAGYASGVIQGPQQMSGVMDYANGMMQGPSYASQLQGPSGSQNYYDQNGQGFRQQGAAERWGAGNLAAFSTPGSYEQWGAQNLDRYNNLGGNQDFSYASSALKAPGATDQIAGRLGSQLEGPGDLRLASPELRARYAGANDIQGFAGRQQAGLESRGTYEDFVRSDISGTNPEYEMAKQEGLSSLNQELARRGQFGSGGAGQSVGKFLGTLQAADYQNRAQRAQSAQQMELARLGQAQGLAAATTGEKLQQAGALQGLATGTESEQMARFGEQRSLAGQQDQMNLQRLSQLAGLANSRGSLDLQALQAQGNEAARMQQTSQGRLTQGMDLAGQTQAAEQARLAAGMNANNQIDAQTLARMQAGAGMDLNRFNAYAGAANQYDTSQLNRANAMFNIGQGTDQMGLAGLNLQGQLAGQQDNAQLAQWQAYMNAANQSQNAQQNRLGAGMAGIAGLGNNMANQYGQFYGAGATASGYPMSDYWNMLANSYQLKAQGNQPATLQYLGAAADIYGATKGK